MKWCNLIYGHSRWGECFFYPEDIVTVWSTQKLWAWRWSQRPAAAEWSCEWSLPMLASLPPSTGLKNMESRHRSALLIPDTYRWNRHKVEDQTAQTAERWCSKYYFKWGILSDFSMHQHTIHMYTNTALHYSLKMFCIIQSKHRASVSFPSCKQKNKQMIYKMHHWTHRPGQERPNHSVAASVFYWDFHLIQNVLRKIMALFNQHDHIKQTLIESEMTLWIGYEIQTLYI